MPMRTRTIGSHRSNGGNGGIQHPKSEGSPKQDPLYSLTLDEVQHKLGELGKPLTSTNLDELLKSVWTSEAEANQGTSSDFGPVDRKTTPEKEKQPTSGEMTLEDFLAKEGIVAKSSLEKEISGAKPIALPQQNINPKQAQWMQNQILPIQHQQHLFMPGQHEVQQPIPTSIMDAAYSKTQMTMSPSSLSGSLSDTKTPGRKRAASGDIVEKSVERRQKRMIKNRESAARSRARKQAYTHELENKVSRLEEENERLKREQEAENMLPCVPPPEPKYQLRRTSSTLF